MIITKTPEELMICNLENKVRIHELRLNLIDNLLSLKSQESESFSIKCMKKLIKMSDSDVLYMIESLIEDGIMDFKK